MSSKQAKKLLKILKELYDLINERFHQPWASIV